MIDPLQTALIAGSLFLAALAAVYVALDRLTDRLLLAVLVVLELGLLVQAVVGIAQVASDDPGVNAVVFVGYLLGALLFLPAATVWALGEPSRAGTAADRRGPRRPGADPEDPADLDGARCLSRRRGPVAPTSVSAGS